MDKSPTKNHNCPVCHTNIGFLSKKVECSNCKLLVCKDHSVLHENSNHFCDLCEKLIIKTQNFPDVVYQIDSLKAELKYLTKDKKKYQKEILMKNDIINRLDKQYKSNQVTYQEKLESLEKKIDQEKKKLNSEENLLQHLEKSLIESQKSEKSMIEKLNYYIQELHNANVLYEEIHIDQIFLLNKIDTLRVELRGFAPINRLKLISCGGCFKKVKQGYFEVFRTASILEGNSSTLSSISIINQNSSEEALKRKQALCNGCNII